VGPHSTAQLNLQDPDGGQQFDRIAALGAFDAPLPQPYKAALTASTTDNLAEPSYLHTNCSFCHRPGGVYPSFDLRFDTPFADRAICDAHRRCKSRPMTAPRDPGAGQPGRFEPGIRG
jgi:hypothetical protein